ncbi:TPA: ArdC-like ssDNA-binding domain-containing protein [Bacillus cereus]
MSTVYEIVTENMIKKLEEGTIPWRKPWVGESVAVNWKTQIAYRGINQFLLSSGEYATYKQITEAGGRIKEGEGKNYSIAVFWKWIRKKERKMKKVKRKHHVHYYVITECMKLIRNVRD